MDSPSMEIWFLRRSSQRVPDEQASEAFHLREWPLFWKKAFKTDGDPSLVARKVKGLKQGAVLDVLRSRDSWSPSDAADEIRQILRLPHNLKDGVKYHIRNLKAMGHLITSYSKEGKPYLHVREGIKGAQ